MLEFKRAIRWCGWPNVAVALFFCVLGGCDKPPPKPAKIRVATILPLTGPTAYLGQNERVGIEMGLQELGEEAQQLEFVIEDSQGKGDVTVSAIRKLHDVDGVDLFVVSTTSPVLAALEALKDSKRDVLLIAQTMMPHVTKGYPFAWRLYAASDQEADLLATYAKKKQFRRVAVLRVDNRWGEETLNLFRIGLQGSPCEIVFAESFSASERDFRVSLEKVRAAKPDVLLVITYSTGFPVLFKQMQEGGLDLPVLGNSDLVLGEMPMRIDAGFLSKVVFPAPRYYFATNDLRIAEFNERLQAKGLAPNFDIGYFRDMTVILAKALAKSESSKPADIARAIPRVMPFDGVTGTIRLAEDRDIRADLKLVRWTASGLEIVP